jgi:hypothetical protein
MPKASRATQGDRAAPQRPDKRRSQQIAPRRSVLPPKTFFWNIALYIAIAVILGQLNILIFYVDTYIWEKPIHYQDMLADGGLFFYSMTLLGGSVYAISTCSQRALPHMKFMKVAIIGVFLVITSLVMTLASRNVSVYIDSGKWEPTDTFIRFEVWTAIVSAVMAFGTTALVEFYSSAEVRSPALTADNKLITPNF